MPLIEGMKFKKPILVGNLDIYDEIRGTEVNKFDLNCDERQQIENLANAMLNFSSSVNETAYEETVARYSPDRLGKIVRDFILSEMKEK